jgi:hypothetical protein
VPRQAVVVLWIAAAALLMTYLTLLAFGTTF